MNTWVTVVCKAAIDIIIQITAVSWKAGSYQILVPMSIMLY
jgi:hypothetical protein